MVSPPQSPAPSATSSHIWSSRSPSPTSSPQTSAPSTSQSAASTDSAQAPPADPSNTTTFTIPQSIEGSEQPLIARTHYTNGYRAGISAGKDDPEIAQGGFDEGFPLGAVLAMRVGYLLEGVRSVLRDGGGGQGVDGRVGDIGGADKVREGTTDQTQGQIVEAQLAEAQRELSLEHLVGEMETLGILENDVHTGLGESASIHDVVRSLPSVAKWSRVVEARGLTASPG